MGFQCGASRGRVPSSEIPRMGLQFPYTALSLHGSTHSEQLGSGDLHYICMHTRRRKHAMNRCVRVFI